VWAGVNFSLRSLAFCILIAYSANAADPLFELDGRIEPQAQASVSIYGVSVPFSESALSDAAGHFRFKKLLAGAYTIAVLVPGRGEARLTEEVGRGTADSKNRVEVVLKLSDDRFALDPRGRDVVSARELKIPDRAHREFEEAEKALSKRDGIGASAHLEKAVEIAPQFEAAWNNLGTIAYRAADYSRAEQCFRRALAADPQAYEALVNLGGVLINLHRLEEAELYNQHAVLVRPGDALANSQLGTTFFELDQLDAAEKYLDRARSLDPAHFSHPQLLLAEIELRRGQPRKAAAELEDFLKYHPDWPQAARLRQQIAKWRMP